MKIRSPLLGLSLTLLLGLNARVFAQDASIDQLLKKLPPPEKFAKSPVERALQQSDPADKDPLLKDIVQALRMRNGQRAFNLSHQLIQRHPESPAAYCINAIIAAGLRQYAEASSNLRKAIELRPKLAFPYFLLGDVEATQQHFGAALPHFRKRPSWNPRIQSRGSTSAPAPKKPAVNKRVSITRNARPMFHPHLLAAGFSSRAPRILLDTQTKRSLL